MAAGRKSPTNRFSKLPGPWDRLFPFLIVSIRDETDGLTISIEDNREGLRKGRFKFDSYYGYRNFNESDLINYWQELNGVSTTGLYVAGESEFLEWAARQSVHESLPEGVTHYMIVSVEDVLEVLSFDPPAYEEL